MHVIEGGTDAVIFENFIYHCLKKLRTDPTTRHKHIVVLMFEINAQIIALLYLYVILQRPARLNLCVYLFSKNVYLNALF